MSIMSLRKYLSYALSTGVWKKNVQHTPNENLRNGFDNEETQKTKWALFTIWLQIVQKWKSPSICTKFKKSERVTKDVQNPEIQMKMTW